MPNCKKCLAEIRWLQIKGKWVPQEPFGGGRHVCQATASAAQDTPDVKILIIRSGLFREINLEGWARVQYDIRANGKTWIRGTSERGIAYEGTFDKLEQGLAWLDAFNKRESITI